MNEKSLQETFAPKGICFGCGCLNDKGLKIKSFINKNEIVCDWKASKYHEAFPGVLNGGIIGSILDCHSNWAAAYFLMKHLKLDSTPCTVTADYSVKLRRPTPSNALLHITAKLANINENIAVIDAFLYAEEKICASFVGTFVSVNSDHPAFHRW